jgi:hypothetical protein
MYRTSPYEPGYIPQHYKLGDKVKAHTKPWSPNNIHGHGHHELWNNQIGVVTLCFKAKIRDKFTEEYYYWIKFPHTTYIAVLSDNEMSPTS